jgi:N-acetyl-gamma-glutamylphosphate reductase
MKRIAVTGCYSLASILMPEFLLTGESALLDTRERFPFPGQSLSGDSGAKNTMICGIKAPRITKRGPEMRAVKIPGTAMPRPGMSP